MEHETPFAPKTLDVARERLTTLFDAYRVHTGLAPTFIGIIARGGDPKFFRSYMAQDFGFRSYDTVVSRFSAIWPDDLPWPADVPRQAPAAIEPEMLEELTSRLARLGKASTALPAAALDPIMETASHG